MTSQPQDKQGLQRQIDENLRRVYQQTVEEQVPDRLLELLSKLRDQEKAE